MKNMKRIFTSLLTVLVLVMALAPSAMAAGARIEITGKKNSFKFSPGSSLSTTDLFPEFKNVMPGDTLTQSIEVTHNASDIKKLKLYMRAVPHSASNLPQQAVLGHEGSVEAMNDFLAQLQLKLWKGTDTSKTPIYSGAPNGDGGRGSYILLGEFVKGRTGYLTAELTVPISMGNEYADRMGEVDWEFMIEEVPETKPGTSPKTGDETNPAMLITVAVLSLAALAVVVILMVRSKKKKQ